MTEKLLTKPEGLEERHLAFFDELRKSGVTNMWGAASYLEEEFPVSKAEAKAFHLYWIKSYGERHPKGGA